MSAETQLPPLQDEIDTYSGTEALKQSAQNFVIGLGLAVHKAEQTHLVYGRTDDIVYVATPAKNIGQIVVKRSEEATRYILIPSIPQGLYSKDPAVEYETIEAVNGATQLKVKVCKSSHIKGEQPVYLDMHVDNIVKSQVIEAFVANLQPISREEYDLESEYQASKYSSANRTSFAEKVGKLLRRSK